MRAAKGSNKTSGGWLRIHNRLARLAGWDSKLTAKFRTYLLEYASTPSYKKVLSSMIKFEDMYRPIVKGPQFTDIFGTVSATNEYRAFMRSKIYMNKRDIIATVDEKGQRRLVITSRGHKIFYKDYPLAELRKRGWDGVWTVVMYDIPESKRNLRVRIHRQLKSLGFGSPQLSSLVTPLPIQEDLQKLIEAEGLDRYLWVLRAKQVLGMSNTEVVRRSYPIDELSGLYGRLLSVLPKINKRSDDESLLNAWREYFLAVNSADPYLPKELLPKDWKGGRCEEEFVKLGSRGLLKALLSKGF